MKALLKWVKERMGGMEPVKEDNSLRSLLQRGEEK